MVTAATESFESPPPTGDADRLRGCFACQLRASLRLDVLHGGTESPTGRRDGAVDEVGRTSDATPATCAGGAGDCRQVVALTMREGDVLGAALARFEAVLRRDGPRIESTSRGPR